MTAEGFRERADAEWQAIRETSDAVSTEQLAEVCSRFERPDYEVLEDQTDTLAAARLENPEFDRWMRHCVFEHQVPGYASVMLSTKVTGIPPGDVTDTQMEAVADWADNFGHGEIRISHQQNFVLPDVRQAELQTLWREASAQQLATPNVGLLTDIICCPGGDYCSLANAKSIPVAEAIQQRFDAYDDLYDLGPIDLNISGCMNACGHHHVGHIGILGVDKKGEEFYQISLGGNSHTDASLGQIVGPSFGRAEVPDVIARILDVFVDNRADEESFLQCFRRIGIEPFKERVYAATH